MNKSFYSILAIGLLCYFLSSCANIIVISASDLSIKVENKVIDMDDSEIPKKQKDKFIKGARLAIKVIHSEIFLDSLEEHIRFNLGTGEHTEAWEGVDANTITQKMQYKIDSIAVNTYGGLRGWWINMAYNNIAYDGGDIGPIRMNRIPLRKKDRTPAQIANTIIHEVAHRVGLKHPHGGQIKFKEPPYIIGNIAEAIILSGQVSLTKEENLITN